MRTKFPQDYDVPGFPALYSGDCQCCGSQQKLPNGRLAKHGYTTRWGFFAGVCPGSGYRPVQLSFDRIERYIQDAEARIQVIEGNRKELLKPATEPRAWFHLYIGGRVGYQWTMVELMDQGGVVTGYITPKGKVQPMPSGFYDCKNSLEAATRLNSQRAKSLLKDIEKLKEYIKWQQQRLAEWTVRPVVPVVT